MSFEDIIIIIVFGPCIGVMILYVILRFKEFPNFARSLDFSFYRTLTEYDEGYKLEKQLEEFSLFREGSYREFGNIIVGKINDIDVKIFEYYFKKWERQEYLNGQIVFLFESKDLYFPKFQLRAKGGIWQREIKLPFESHVEIDDGPPLLSKDYQFDPHPKFTSKYLLRGADKALIKSIFTKEILSYFENQKPRMSVEAVGNKLIVYKVYKHDSSVEHGELASLYKKGLEVFNLLKSSVLANI